MLDYWLISDTLQDLVKNVDIIVSIKTDHSASVLHLQGVEETKNDRDSGKLIHRFC